MRTVLIVDRDLGFAFWLGQALDRSGYQALPAKSCEDATELLRRLNVVIDLLVVNGSLAGAGAFADALRASQSHLNVIAVTGDGEEQRGALPGADASHRKCSRGGEASEREWLETIKGVFDERSLGLGSGC